MQNIVFDSGVEEFAVNGGVLRFNPSDPNLYARFLDTGDKIKKLEQELAEKASECVSEDAPQAMIRLMQQADMEIKKYLNHVFGQGNDFETLMQGVNLLAVAGNGERVITNLFDTLTPILVRGAQRCAGEKIQDAVEKANARRASQ